MLENPIHFFGGRKEGSAIASVTPEFTDFISDGEKANPIYAVRG
jgi:hypothetical protein